MTQPTPTSVPANFPNVTATCVANVYFDGGVVSHAIQLAEGEKKTLGLIRPGAYVFNTDAAELMQITAGSCRVRLAGEPRFTPYATGQSFNVPAKSRFEIAVDDGLCQYICSFLA